MSQAGAIITGAASGVGLALTKHLLDKGWKVVMIDINPDGKQPCEELGDMATWIHCDIGSWDDLVRAEVQDHEDLIIERVAFEWCPNITFLAANAGIVTNPFSLDGLLSPSETIQCPKPTLKPLYINFVGTVYCIKLFLNAVHRRPKTAVDGNATVEGRIVITSSEAGLYKLPADPIYCASKHALVGLTRSLGPTYLNSFGITVNSIAPGYVPTPLVAPLIPITPTKYATPLTTMLRAFDQLVASEESGQILETSGDNLHLRPQMPYPDQVSK
ncbi:NAD(P)-binding protein [Cadophora sp. DSE1049]|nr:NAD(P)-binding protein [Cadophora sp. DSE1049]